MAWSQQWQSKRPPWCDRIWGTMYTRSTITTRFRHRSTRNTMFLNLYKYEFLVFRALLSLRGNPSRAIPLPPPTNIIPWLKYRCIEFMPLILHQSSATSSCYDTLPVLWSYICTRGWGDVFQNQTAWPFRNNHQLPPPWRYYAFDPRYTLVRCRETDYGIKSCCRIMSVKVSTTIVPPGYGMFLPESKIIHALPKNFSN